MELEDPINDPATRRFLGLAPERVLDVVDAVKLRPTGRFQQLNSLENRVFSVEVEPFELTVPGHGQETLERVVVKIYRPGR